MLLLFMLPLLLLIMLLVLSILVAFSWYCFFFLGIRTGRDCQDANQ
jgi:hypothetical protein